MVSLTQASLTPNGGTCAGQLVSGTRNGHDRLWGRPADGQHGFVNSTGMAAPSHPCPPSDAVPGVEIHGLVKRYGTATAVDGLTLTAPRGQVTALLGPNGAGKTTTVEICEGSAAPTRAPSAFSAATPPATVANSNPVSA